MLMVTSKTQRSGHFESKRGAHSQSIDPLRETSALVNVFPDQPVIFDFGWHVLPFNIWINLLEAGRAPG